MTRWNPRINNFWQHVVKSGPDQCWPWDGPRRASGYGSVNQAGRHTTAHRVAWEWANAQPVPDGLVVRHTCDNPPCCNPAHLLIGTPADNVQDAVDRGRIAREFRKPNTRLSDADVREIRALYYSPRRGSSNSAELAAAYGVSRNYIAEIVRGSRRQRA